MQNAKGLKNLTRVQVYCAGRTTWELRDGDGLKIRAFTVFCQKNCDYAFATQKRYAEAVSRFLDYLFEANVFSHSVAQRHLNAVVEAYVVLLRDGSALTAERVMRNGASASQDAWLVDVAFALKWAPVKASSCSNALAAVNRFLALSESLAWEEFEKATFLGIAHQYEHQRLIAALHGETRVSRFEVNAMRQNSLLGSVAKFAPNGLKRPRRLRSRDASTQLDTRVLAFPLECLQRLIDAATSWRDKALWLLLAASGIRMSEAKNLLFEDLDFENQRIFVFDPAGRRPRVAMIDADPQRFKGRVVSMTYLFQPLREAFFKALAMYQAHEFVPVGGSSRPNYVFQYVEGQHRGAPFVTASDSTVAKSFKKAVRRAGIPPRQDGSEWTPHSLRHLYGDYMLNDFPVDPIKEVFGLQLVEVQMLMGHASIASTRHYARAQWRRLHAKLDASDEALLGLYRNDMGQIRRDGLHSLKRTS